MKNGYRGYWAILFMQIVFSFVLRKINMVTEDGFALMAIVYPFAICGAFLCGIKVNQSKVQEGE